MKKITTILLAFTILTAVFVSCKKDDETVKATGSASAQLTVASASATTWTATSATAVKTGTSYTITAPGPNSTNLVIKVDNVSAIGTFTLTTATRAATFTTGGKTYATTNNGGGNVIITAISADKIEGTFLCEMFDATTAGALYCSLGSGKFSATF
ncbi:DUF6252 family protein [Pedobacter frigiditerrae]|uniref:DUF6252 family protein n=1 Tax=Pedobacter frigiditerrae TaxID=2530452 RepID=UPI00292D9BBD|nr:DUF6252 family protein [Pedobacter frigiditerrae]